MRTTTLQSATSARLNLCTGVLVKSTSASPQVRLTRKLPAYCRVVFDNPPLNLMGPEFVVQFKKIMTEIEADENVKVVVFESAVEDYFLNHSDFLAKLEDLTNLPQGPTGLEAWPDIGSAPVANASATCALSWKGCFER